MPTRTDKVPNTSPSAASASTDLNGAAVFDACSQIKSRITPIAALLLECDDTAVRFESGWVYAAGSKREPIAFKDAVEVLKKLPAQVVRENWPYGVIL